MRKVLFSNIKNSLISKKTRSTLPTFLFSISVLLFFTWMIWSAAPWIKDQPLFFKSKMEVTSTSSNTPDVNLLRAENLVLQKKLDKMTPGGVYLVINTSDNTFFLYKNKELFRNGMCSTGSYIKLEADNEKSWIFETPKGVFTIKGKITNPVWRKPDWAFVEEGLPVPPAGDPSRYEYGVLGDYALSLGDGYLIHGTLYKRFLGMPVTHGCVRMGDDDLEAVYQTLPVGAKVFIF